MSTLLRRLGIPDDVPRVVLVNGHDADDDRPLQPDDVVSAFPPLAGGSVPNGTGLGSVLPVVFLRKNEPSDSAIA